MGNFSELNPPETHIPEQDIKDEVHDLSAENHALLLLISAACEDLGYDYSRLITQAATLSVMRFLDFEKKC